MLRMWTSVVLMGFCLGGCGSSLPDKNPSKSREKIIEEAQGRYDPLRKDRVGSYDPLKKAEYDELCKRS